MVAGVKGEGDYKGHRGVWGVRKLFYILIEEVIMTVCISQKSTIEKVNFTVCELYLNKKCKK